MKKLLIPLFVMIGFTGYSQLNNSWIDYSKTYYKFKVGKDSLYRITQPTLSAIGLQNVPAQNFQLFRNGKEVRIYTSLASGPLASNDYIEFWGEANDGKPDNNLYRNTDYQLNDRYSLFADTAVYFLTVNPSGNNLRYTVAANNPPGSLQPEPYFMRRVETNYRSRINRGYAAVVGEYVYASDYDQGEGWTSNETAPCCDLVEQLSGLNVYTSGPPNGVSFSITAFGNALNTRNLRVKLWYDTIVDRPMPYFSYLKVQKDNIPLSALLSTDAAPIYMENTSSNASDYMVVGRFALTYPARFIFNNKKNFYFELKNSSLGNYLVIDNFNYGTTAPVLIDINNGLRYTGDIVSTPGKVKVVLPPSADTLRKFLLVSQEPANVVPINALTQKTFTNYAITANQGDYIIISNPALYNNGSGVNNVDLYRQYRNSLTGGGYNAKIIPIDELDDQFAFGIKKHPAAIRDFIRYSNQQFVVKPKYIFLIGRGTDYHSYKDNEADPIADKINLIQTFGWPASDILLACEPGTVVPIVPIGRLAAVNGNEVGIYLQKMKDYEQAQQSPSQTIADKGWMKNIIHVTGGHDSLENAEFNAYMDSYKVIAEDTLFGAHVESFTKSSTAAIQEANSQRIEQLFNEGLSFIGYFGHSSANQLEFNLNDPANYMNQGKYPFVNVSGCSAGNFFIFDPQRLNGNMTLSEKYVLTNQRGSIAFLADTHFGIPPFLNFYNTLFYNAFCRNMYGNTAGNQIRTVIQGLGGNPQSLDYYTRIHIEEITLHGDPALKINSFAKPDYVIEDPLIKISPSIISVADVNFNLDVKMMNIGKAIKDSIRVKITRKLPNDTVNVLYNKLIPAIKYMDSVSLVVPINPLTDKGLNHITVTLDVDNRVDELSETNNSVTKDFYIFEDELRPVYPYNYSIVNQQNITFSGSTANPLSGSRQYVMELDTTELFNSPYKKIYNNSGPGGIVQFTPAGVTFTDSTVYYWRTAMVPLGTAPYIWNSFSFIYLPNSSSGFNQSHYYQHLKSSYENINLSNSRRFNFRSVTRNLVVNNGVYPPYDYDVNNINMDFSPIEFWGCIPDNIRFFVFDSLTLKPWENINVGPNGRFGSQPVCNAPRLFFEFPYQNPVYRKRAMDFIDSIPNGMYVLIENLEFTDNTAFISQWQNDTLTLGSGHSLYHKLKSIGFSKIDSFTTHRPFVFFYRKGTPSFTPIQAVTTGDSLLTVSIPLQSYFTSGTITSPQFGPAKKWNALHWRGNSLEAAAGDTARIQVYGIKLNGTSDLLATVSPAVDTTLAFINAAVYPYISLEMLNSDVNNATPYQLRYWRINADYVPEGAVAPNTLFKFTDTVDQGQKIDFSLAFKNISPVAFDSLIKIKFIITDRNNIPHVVNIPKGKALQPNGDTLVVNYSIDTKNYPGNNTLFIDFNPDNDQPEQYHFNNILYKNFFVREDRYNPLLDVTFDGVHILNKDIVASKPHIIVKLKDESKYLALNDTSLVKVQVRFPDNSIHQYRFGPDTLRFTPANLSTGENAATVDFLPYFPLDGEYELIVSGKDVVGNTAGQVEYHVIFTVINKPMISNMLNYPNPFTTSTAFVFTVTGSDVPQNIRIQVLTITGKIVREITKEELGPIHIGRNITDFKWDGTDMYGQKLANGVYLYRVITNLNGKSLDKYKAEGDNTDKYFNKGYGKMYLMR